MHKPLRGTPFSLPHPLARGLVGGWIMNEASGDRLFDCSGRYSHAALVNMTPSTAWLGGPRGSVLRFLSTSSQYGMAPDTGSFVFPTGHFTVEAIATWDGNDVWASLGGIDDTSGNNLGTFLMDRRSDNEKLYFRVFNTAAGSVWATTSAALTADRWYHFVGVYDGSAHIYVDGALENSSGSLTGSRAQAQGPLWIGAHDFLGSAASFWSGQIELFRLWERALSDPEIRSLSREPYAMFEQQLPLWSFAGLPSPPPSGPTLFSDHTPHLTFADATERTDFRDASQRTDFTWNVS